MRIGITVNEVLRDHISRFHEIYEKYIALNEIKREEITSDNLSEFFKFSNDENYTRFLYESASVEIFGFADTMNSKLFEDINEFLYDFYADNKASITVLSKEFNRSLGATLFWFSKVNSEFRDFKFVETYENIWNEFDLIITATPEILLSKPKGKISIKIEAPYNENIDSDFSFKETNELFGVDGKLNKIIKK